MKAVSTAAGGAATTGTGRVGNLDVLRAVAALGVLAGHAYQLGGRGLPLRAETIGDALLLTATTGVWLFFGISGYVIGKPFVDRLVGGRPLPDLVPYALKRAFRIFPLYWVALTATILVAGAAGTRAWHYPVHYGLLHNLVPGRQQAIYSVAWTLTVEILFYIALPIAAFAIRKRWASITPERLATLILISWVASIGFTVVAGLQEPGTTSAWLRQSVLSMWQMFCPGLLLAVAPHLRAPTWRRWVVEFPGTGAALIAAAGLAILGAFLSTYPPDRFGLTVTQLVVDAGRPMFAIAYGILIAAAILARPRFQQRGRWVLHLGLVSYGIYLLHAVIASALVTGKGQPFIPFPDGGLLAYVVHLAFLVALTVPLAMLSWRWFERPAIGLAVTLANRWRGGGPTAREPRQPWRSAQS